MGFFFLFAETCDNIFVKNREADLDTVNLRGIPVILQVGLDDWTVTLIGHRNDKRDWRFARLANPAIQVALGAGEDGAGEDVWVEGWDPALALMDVYPWALLTPLDVHKQFLAPVRLAVEERLKRAASRDAAERARTEWQRLFEQKK